MRNTKLLGGRFSFGVIPTPWESGEKRAMEPAELFSSLLSIFGKLWGNQPHLIRHVLARGLYTPACGLALHSPSDAESVAGALAEFVKLVPVAEGE